MKPASAAPSIAAMVPTTSFFICPPPFAVGAFPRPRRAATDRPSVHTARREGASEDARIHEGFRCDPGPNPLHVGGRPEIPRGSGRQIEEIRAKAEGMLVARCPRFCEERTDKIVAATPTSKPFALSSWSRAAAFMKNIS
jgi:hypothetical protein